MDSSSNILTHLLDLVFPQSCVCCGLFNCSLCQKCQKKIAKINEYICPFCLASTKEGRKHPSCKGCIDGLVSCWSYEGVGKKVIKAIKYRYYYAIVPQVMEVYWRSFFSQKNETFAKFLESKPIIIPVPLHPKRQKLRGFNQSELIAKEVSKRFGLPFSKRIVIRKKLTKPQAELKKKERLQNMTNAFSPSPEVLRISKKPLKGRSVLLIDDVWTTGSTMQACAKVLKSLGAEKIWAFTLAR